MQNLSAQQIIKQLNLSPLEGEGGFFRRTYESSLFVNVGGASNSVIAGTAIYYLMTPDSFSALHQLRYDEIYHFYAGDPVEMFLIYKDGKSETIILGSNFMNGEYPQFVVPAGAWQGSRVKGNRWSLLGTTMSPGFDYRDFSLGIREKLISVYPEQSEKIRSFTRSE